MHICYTGGEVISTDDILLKIRQANAEELDAIIDVVTHRHSELYPQWDLTFLPLPRNNSRACVEKPKMMITFIEKHQRPK